VDPKKGLFTCEDNSSQDAQWVSCINAMFGCDSLEISNSDVFEREQWVKMLISQ